MSGLHPLKIVPTAFVGLDHHGEEYERGWGITMEGGGETLHLSGYAREEVVRVSPADLVKLVLATGGERARDMVQFSEENGDGVTIGYSPVHWSALYAAGVPATSPRPRTNPGSDLP